MPIENPLPAFFEWFSGAQWYSGAALTWLVTVVVLTACALLIGYLVTALRYGPVAGAAITGRVLAEGFEDLVRMSPRRVGALAGLAVKESIRRRVVVVFAVFLLLLLAAAWFLDPSSIDPARLYLGFVLTATTYLVLLLALFLSAFSLPGDIKSRTLHTIVTKPVRASEIVLGRMLGFVIVGTALLGMMAVVSYVFVVRGLDHSHELAADDLGNVATSPDGKQTRSGFTKAVQGHRHRVSVDGSGNVRLEPEKGHWHDATIDTAGRYRVGPSEGMLVARVPLYGKLRFRDPRSVDTEKGINVGDEWAYRSFIQGGSQAAAIWTFNNVTEKGFADGLPLEMNIEVFRTFKGNVEKGVFGSLALRNPRTGLKVEVTIFESKDFVIVKSFIPRRIVNFSSADVIARKTEANEGTQWDPAPPAQLDKSLANKKEFDLFDDLVADGQVEVWLQCLEPAQYFGASVPDLYLRSADAPFFVNFFKGYLGIWFQMTLVTAFGVMFSTFLSGPVAMLATTGALVGGFFSESLTKLAHREMLGGGPFEAMTRIVRQENLISDLEPGLRTDVTRLADMFAAAVLRVISAILPSFGDFSYANWVAYGFDVLWDPYVAIPMLRTLAYLIPVFVAGYFFLKTREVAR